MASFEILEKILVKNLNLNNFSTLCFSSPERMAEESSYQTLSVVCFCFCRCRRCHRCHRRFNVNTCLSSEPQGKAFILFQ